MGPGKQLAIAGPVEKQQKALELLHTYGTDETILAQSRNFRALSKEQKDEERTKRKQN